MKRVLTDFFTGIEPVKIGRLHIIARTAIIVCRIAQVRTIQQQVRIETGIKFVGRVARVRVVKTGRRHVIFLWGTCPKLIAEHWIQYWRFGDT